MSTGIVILGLGPGAPEQITRQAWDWLAGCGEVWLRTTHHPSVSALPDGLRIFSFDDLYDNSEKFEEVYAAIVEKVMELGKRAEGVTYAVPGHPMIAETTGPEILRRARTEGVPVRVIDGLSFLEPTFTALGLDPFPNLALVDALELSATLMPQFPSSQPALVAQIYSRQVAANVKMTLGTVYPDEHPVRLVHNAGTDRQKVEDLKLYEIDRSKEIGLLTALYLPPLAADTSFENFQEVIARLRAPDGCPWDREQTHLTLRKHLLEETYETLAALDDEDAEGMREEFGDLLLQIVLHAQIAFEEGEFSMTDVLQGISQKIVRRHPHVFGEVKVDGVHGVLQNWDKLKAAERKDNGDEKHKGLLDSVPKNFPALGQAQQVQERAARVGFDWGQVDAVWTRLMEAAQAARAAHSPEERNARMGDLLYTAAALARWYEVDAESALRETISRFRRRFADKETQAKAAGHPMNELKPAELDTLWNEKY
jgi:tetrapyrrole methylase family protein / MazG family protein